MHDSLTYYALPHSVCDLKAAQMDVQCCLIWELMLNKFEQGPNTSESTTNISAKGEGTVNSNTVTM